ncbi:Hypothetical predicted protein [Mytilus galloprovincialis]|uniref:Uncharacterized protein n=1 Tax=Mytilus galloprovincialis TaxID=29158 RepID=A0A8B6DF70_MYTGA|nr:Hypothetical predicted protein [Mytilus galloprovincialis]
MTVLADGSEFLTECFQRSGEFYVLRRLIGTDYFFSCAKNTLHDINNSFVVYYYTPFTYYPRTPTLCDVCNGTNLFNENLNDLGCNLPSVCQVTDPVIQERCPPCNHAFDDGLCCP